jgi:hypothetical protein
MTVLEEHAETFEKLYRAEIATASAWKTKFEYFLGKREELKKELASMTVAGLKKIYRGFYPNRRKEGLIDDIVEEKNAAFALGGFSYSLGLEAPTEGIKRTVEGLTDKAIAEYVEKRNARIEEYRKALNNPETLDEFEILVGRFGEGRLTPEQIILYDELRAIDSRDKQEAAENRGQILKQVNPENTQWTMKESVHKKNGIPIYIIQLSERISREDFQELNSRAKKLGGRYSSFVKEDAGFTFADRAAAESFLSLRNRDVDRGEFQKEQTEKIKKHTATRLLETAARMEEKAQAKINQDRLCNTARRAKIADGIEAEAREDIAKAKTLRNLADAIQSKKAVHLDGLTAFTQLEALDTVLRYAMTRRIRKEQIPYGQSRDLRMGLKDVEYVRYPWPNPRYDDLTKSAELLKDKDGYKRAAVWAETKVKEALANGDEDRWSVDLARTEDQEMLEKVIEGVKDIPL